MFKPMAPQKKKAPARKLSVSDWGFSSSSGKKQPASASFVPSNPEAVRISCTISGTRPRWKAADDSFAIWTAVLEEDGKSSQIAVQGPIARVSSGEMLHCGGRWKRHPKHGWSFHVSDFESALPANASGIAAWLETRVDGVGPTFARAIVDHFGADDVFAILDANPSRLREVRTEKGRALPEKQVQKAIDAWDDAKAIRQIESFLFSHGISARLADRLYRAYGEEVIEIMQEDPYRITELRGIGFRIADRVALSMGVAKDDPDRLKAGVLFVLEEAESDGHVFLGLESLVGASMSALDVGKQEPIVDACSALATERKLVTEADEAVHQRVYLSHLYDLECRLARSVRSMCTQTPAALYPKPKRPKAPEGATPEEIEKLRLPTDEQWEVMEDVRNQRLTILSGNPGVGKCVRGDTPVLVNGRPIEIEALWEKEALQVTRDGEGEWSRTRHPLRAASLETDGTMSERPVLHLYRQYVKEPGQKISLADGSSLTMTRRHRVLTTDGWSNAVLPGDRVAVPSTLPEPEGASSVSENLLRLLAWQIAEGHERDRGPDRTKSADLRDEVHWVRVRSVEDIQLDEWVYDMEIEETHNYVAGGIISHNTQSVNEIVRLAESHNLKLKLCAPTGKAARRMSELTGHPATTIHRLLEFSPFEGGFQRDETNPLEADLLVVDEASMLSLDLADSLFRALPDEAHLLLVGDPDQLPPVGVGKVLDDLILSEAVPRVHLSKIFRQAARSMIIQNSRRINAGKLPYLSQSEAEGALGSKMLNDFYWVTRKEPARTLELTLDMVTNRIPRTFGFDPKTEIMVLAPMRKGVVGLEALNAALEERLNSGPDGKPKKPIIPKRGISVGSRIVQTKNSYDEHHYVMNGEIALVLDYRPSSSEALLSLDDGEREIWVPTSDMDSYMLAWAMSVHRSQGSQWPCVVAPVSSSFYVMLTRSLVYTAVTRAAKLCVMTGEKKALSMAVDKVDARRRNSTLAARVLDPAMSGELF